MKKLKHIYDFDENLYKDTGTTSVCKCHTYVDPKNINAKELKVMNSKLTDIISDISFEGEPQPL